VHTLSSAEQIDHRVIRMVEKLMHFGLTLALDNTVAEPQKREVMIYVSESP